MTTLTPDQNRAVDAALSEQMTGLIGLAGTGKTQSALGIVNRLRERGYRPLLTAPTHKAAKVLAKKSGHEAQTLHSLLNLIPMRDLKSGERRLSQINWPDLDEDSDVLIVDEASMLSPYMLECINAVNLRTILIGDPGQLPPVGYTESVFTQWLRDQGAPIFSLTQILRQAGENPLPTVAATLRPGVNNPVWPRSDVMGSDGGVRILRRPQAEAEFLAHARDYDGDEENVRPWLTYTNIAAQAMAYKARVAHYGDAARKQPYLKGETCVLAGPLIREGVIVIANSAVVTILTEPEAIDVVLYTVPARVYDMRVQTDTGGVYDIQAVPMAARNELMQALRAIAMATYGPARETAWSNYFDVDDLAVDLRSIFSSTIHKSQGSSYLDAFIDSSSLNSSNAGVIKTALMYTAITRPYHTGVVAL